MKSKTYRIAIVVGESSGDLLAAALIKELKQSIPNVVFEGVAGPKMIDAGCAPIIPDFKFGIMGFHQVLFRLPYFVYVRHKLIKYFMRNRPDMFIGVDFTEFNLSMAKKLKKLNVPTVQYKGPSVWAWRQSRLSKVKKSVDLILTIFPFEQKFYQDNHVKSIYVGHVFAKQIPYHIDQNKIREQLRLPKDQIVISILPGSRTQEIKTLTPIFLDTINELVKEHSNLVFIVGLINEDKASLFKDIALKHKTEADLIQFVGKTREVIAVSNIVLVASGTATLETMLFKKPMVVVYKVSKVYEYILRKMIKVSYISLPNLLADQKLVPELFQESANATSISNELIRILNDDTYQQELVKRFGEMHKSLFLNTSLIIRDTIMKMLVENEAKN